VQTEPLSNGTDHIRLDPSRHSNQNMLTAPDDIEAKASDTAIQAGIGVALKLSDEKVYINTILSDTPAERSKLLKPNDRVVAIAEVDSNPIDVTRTKKLAKVVGMIRGPVGTVVRLTIVPEGSDENDQIVVSLVRCKIKEIDKLVQVHQPFRTHN